MSEGEERSAGTPVSWWLAPLAVLAAVAIHYIAHMPRGPMQARHPAPHPGMHYLQLEQEELDALEAEADEEEDEQEP